MPAKQHSPQMTADALASSKVPHAACTHAFGCRSCTIAVSPLPNGPPLLFDADCPISQSLAPMKAATARFCPADHRCHQGKVPIEQAS